MKSYTTGRNLYGSWTKNTASANLTLGDQMANDNYRHLCALKDWPFLEQFRTLTTQASTQFYNLPYDTSQVREISVKVNSITYTPKLSPSREHWDMLNLTSFTSDIPEWYFVYAGQVGLWPKPASTGNTIQLTIKCRVIDLSIPDYTTGTISGITNGATTLTNSGGSWSAGMAGSWVRIDTSNTANWGDGLWYQISSVTNTNNLELVRAYGGSTISLGNATYTIGQMPLLPEDFHDTPWKYAAYLYWSKEDDERAASFKAMYEEDVASLIATWSAPTTDMVVDDGRDPQIINPNLVIRL